MRATTDPVELNGIVLNVSASMGVSLYPQDTNMAEDQLMRQADQAMYHAKNAGRQRAHLHVSNGEPTEIYVGKR